MFPAEAAVYEVWSFVALRLLPDVAFWRWPMEPVRGGGGELRHNRERFIGVDLTRHAFGRLWWTARVATTRAEDPARALDWLERIGEADLEPNLHSSRRLWRLAGGVPLNPPWLV